MDKTLPSLTRFAAMLVLTLALPAQANNDPAAATPGTTGQKQLESFVRERLDDNYRTEIEFGKLPRGTQLAPCRKIEPFLPPGTRLWGRTRLGVRCRDGARWTVALPMQVRVFGPVLVAAHALRARSPLSSGDVSFQEVELTRLNGTPLTDMAAVDGQMMSRSVRAGQPLMTYHLRQIPTVKPGDPIRVQIQGRGFSIAANGSALSQGSDGQPLRVRTDAGRVVVGTLHGRTVRIRM